MLSDFLQFFGRALFVFGLPLSREPGKRILYLNKTEKFKLMSETKYTKPLLDAPMQALFRDMSVSACKKDHVHL
jgi:hypothetical protein